MFFFRQHPSLNSSICLVDEPFLEYSIFKISYSKKQNRMGSSPSVEQKTKKVPRVVKCDVTPSWFVSFNEMSSVSIEELNFKEVIKAHKEYLQKLKLLIESGKDVRIVATDRACIFGKWLWRTDIKGEFENSPVFHWLRKRHLDFHLAAGRLLEVASANPAAGLAQYLDPESEINKISKSLIEKLEQLSEKQLTAAFS